MSKLFSLQGKFFTGVRNGTTGKPGALTWLGNVSEASVSLETEQSDKNESFSGNRLLYGSLQKAKTANLTMTLDELLTENLALGLFGTAASVTGSSVVDEVMPSGLVAGDYIQLAHQFASAIVVKDSTGTPVTLVLGTKYSVESAAGGVLKILDVTALVQPFKVSYSYAAAKNLAMFTNVTPPERWVHFDGYNTADGTSMVIELYRVQFNPVSNLGLINEDWGGLQLTGKVFYDEINAADSTYGGFGRLVTP